MGTQSEAVGGLILAILVGLVHLGRRIRRAVLPYHHIKGASCAECGKELMSPITGLIADHRCKAREAD